MTLENEDEDVVVSIDSHPEDTRHYLTKDHAEVLTALNTSRNGLTTEEVDHLTTEARLTAWMW